MSIRLMSLIFEYDMPAIETDSGDKVSDSSAKFVLLALADHANDEGEGCYPGVRKLCKKTNLSSQTVCNALNALLHNGYTTLNGKSKLETNNYSINYSRFYPLESDDSSHWNRSVLATRTNPSVNHQLTINAGEPPAVDIESLLPSKKSQPKEHPQAPRTSEEARRRIAASLNAGQLNQETIAAEVHSLTGVDPLARSNKTNRSDLALLAANYATPEQFRHFKKWWDAKLVWQSKSGSMPTLANIVEMWATAQAWEAPAESVLLTPAEAQAKARAARGNF